MEIFRKTMDFFQKNSHVFRISWEIIEGTREKKRQKQKGRRNIHKGIHSKNKSTTKTKRYPRQKQIHSKNKRNPQQKQIHGRNKRIPHKIGRKEGQFVPKKKDLRSKILMQTLHFRPKNLVKRIIYCNFVHYKWGFLAAAAIQKLSLL